MNKQFWLILVVSAYFLIFILIGVILKRRIKHATDFLVAGRSLSLWVLAFTIAATHFGGGCVVGGCEWGAKYGIWPGTYSTLACALACFAFAYIAGKFRKITGSITPPDFMEFRYGQSNFLRGYHSLVYVTGCIAIMASQLIGFGYIASIFGIPYWLGVIISVIMVGIYTILSGMWGVAITDFIQLGICILFLPILMVSALKEANMKLGEALSKPFFPFEGSTGIFLYTAVPMVLGSMIAYEYYLRWQSAKEAKTAVRSSVIAGVILMALAVPIGVAGAAGAKLFPNLEAGQVLPKLILDVFPLGIGILFLSILLVAITSSCDSIMTSLGAISSRDIYHKLFNKNKDFNNLKYSLLVARISSGIYLLLAAVVALFIKGVLKVLFWPSPLQVGALFVPFIGGLFWKGATREGAVGGILAGASMALIDMIGIYIWPERVLFPILGSLLAWITLSILSKKRKLGLLSRI